MVVESSVRLSSRTGTEQRGENYLLWLSRCWAEEQEHGKWEDCCTQAFAQTLACLPNLCASGRRYLVQEPQMTPLPWILSIAGWGGEILTLQYGICWRAGDPKI